VTRAPNYNEHRFFKNTKLFVLYTLFIIISTLCKYAFVVLELCFIEY